jgi:hypothetical protein
MPDIISKFNESIAAIFLAQWMHYQNFMKKLLFPLLCVLALLLAGCETRSISNSGYEDPYHWNGGAMYRGELSEFDILGAAPAQEATQTNIAKALETAAAPKIKRGDRLLLIQSGAMVPDNEMMDAAGIYFSLAPFSGTPPADKSGLAESLRLRAAQGGYHLILCYWGVLESAQEDREGKAVSWIPIAGSFVPDQKEQMRIRLKAILVDVATGNWTMLTPEVYSDAHYNSGLSRAESDQKLVMALKAKGYKSLVADLLKD